MAGGVGRDPAGRQNAHEAECRNGSQRRSTCTESTRPRTSRQFLIGRLRHVGAVKFLHPSVSPIPNGRPGHADILGSLERRRDGDVSPARRTHRVPPGTCHQEASIPQLMLNSAPGWTQCSPSPELKALAGPVIGSTASAFARPSNPPVA